MCRKPTWPVAVFCALAVAAFLAGAQPALRPSANEGPNALIILDGSPTGMQEALAALEAAGAQPVHVFPPQAVIARVPGPLLSALPNTPGVSAVFDSYASPAALAHYGPEAQLAGRLWNDSLAQAASPAVALEAASPPPANDFRAVPLPPVHSASSAAPGYYDTSAFLAGKVAIGIILPESTGAEDPSTENWSDARIDQVIAGIESGLDQWARVNPNGDLTFYYDIHRRAPTRYEPINRSSADDALWISDTLAGLGYSGSNWLSRTFAYLNDIRSAYHTDWAVPIFVVDSLNDHDGVFADGYFAYSYSFLIVMTYDNDGWGITNMDSVLAHEFAHVFGAADEYCTPGYSCCTGGGQRGYLGVANTGCAAGCDANANGTCDGDDTTPNSGCHACPNCVDVSCLMRQGYLGAGICPVTRQQVGIRDTDGDGILDPLDTTPAITLDQEPPATIASASLAFSGVAVDVPYASPTGPDITINTISAVECQLDGEAARSALAADGAFDEVTEAFSLPLPPLSDGRHSLTILTRNSQGSAASMQYAVVVDTVPPSSTFSAGVHAHGIGLTWSAEDTNTGVAGVDIQYREEPDGLWTAWRSGPAESSATFLGVEGQTYCFRCRARDAAGNVEAWPPEPGQACVEAPRPLQLWLPITAG